MKANKKHQPNAHHSSDFKNVKPHEKQKVSKSIEKILWKTK